MAPSNQILNQKSSLIVWKFLTKIDLLRNETKEKGFITFETIRLHLDNLSPLTLQTYSDIQMNELITNIADILNEVGLKVVENAHEENIIQESYASVTEQIEADPIKPSVIDFEAKQGVFEHLHERKSKIILQQQKIKNLEEQIGTTAQEIHQLKNSIGEVGKILSKMKHEMVEANLRLIFSIAAKYINRGLPFFNLLHAGKNGLIMAIEEFEFQAGHDFILHASNRIDQAISAAILNTHNNIISEAPLEKNSVEVTPKEMTSEVIFYNHLTKHGCAQGAKNDEITDFGLA